ncbi:MAG: polysulfide reductase NrfD [Desulfobacteraceae bacterium]|nr:polysulfide reductase NrfD [Desulfobacteraceae bacterium]
MQGGRQWITPHEWMTKPTQQTEWIEGQGLLIWMAEVFSALGMGMYLVSVVMDHWWGALVGWLIIVFLKLPFHFFYLGRPWRFWRAIPPFTKSWHSWIARGMFFTTVFSIFALIQLVTTFVLDHSLVAASAVGTLTVIDWIMRFLAGLFALLTGIYCGFMMSYCKSIPFWNTGLLPIVFVIMGIADGLALIMGVGLVTGGVDFHTLEIASQWALIGNAILIGSYLISASYQSTIGELSVRELLVGRVALSFWIGVIFLGIIIPFALSLISIFVLKTNIPEILIIAIISHTIGAFALKYCVLKVGIYRPVVTRAPVM